MGTDLLEILTRVLPGQVTGGALAAIRNDAGEYRLHQLQLVLDGSGESSFRVGAAEESAALDLLLQVASIAAEGKVDIEAAMTNWALPFFVGAVSTDRLELPTWPGWPVKPLLNVLAFEGLSAPQAIPESSRGIWIGKAPPWKQTVIMDIQEGVASSGRAEDRHSTPTLQLDESLSRAHDILARVWPAALQWIDALVPAFVQLRSSEKAPHRSCSYGPGSPISLTRVVDPIVHAEDLVHELQHQRLQLRASLHPHIQCDHTPAAFASPWRADLRPLYGLLLGIHAFAAVNHLRLTTTDTVDNGSNLRLYDTVKTHVRNIFAYETLAQFAQQAKPILLEIAPVLRRQESMLQRIAPSVMRERAEHSVRHHVAAVAARSGGAENADSAVTPYHLSTVWEELDLRGVM